MRHSCPRWDAPSPGAGRAAVVGSPDGIADRPNGWDAQPRLSRSDEAAVIPAPMRLPETVVD